MVARGRRYNSGRLSDPPDHSQLNLSLSFPYLFMPVYDYRDCRNFVNIKSTLLIGVIMSDLEHIDKETLNIKLTELEKTIQELQETGTKENKEERKRKKNN